MAAGGSTFPQPKLKGFVLTEKLGSGSYATVYKAYRKGTQREVVAVKCVLKSSLTKSSTDNLVTEIGLLKKLKHEHIVQLRDFTWDDQYIYLLMEYCTGGDLSKFIQSKRTISEKSAQKFLQQIAKAMHYLHKHNVAHMDLKPQNILLSSLTERPVLKIADFGFAKPLLENDEMVTLRGSPLYMAPEILCKECLFGVAPFASSSYKELGKKIWDNKPVELPHGINVSDECRSILQGLLRRDPDERISFHDFFNHPFVDFEHLPNEDCLPKAISLVDLAVKADHEGNHQKAISLYCDALRFFMPAVQYETDVPKKERLREKVTEYMERAEVLKNLLHPNQRNSSTDSLADIHQQLNESCADNKEVSAALKLLSAADAESEREMYDKALEHYQMALGVLIKHVQGEQSDKKFKDLLTKGVRLWMEKAEQTKVSQSVKQLRTTRIMQQEFIDESSNTQCSLQ